MGLFKLLFSVVTKSFNKKHFDKKIYIIIIYEFFKWVRTYKLPAFSNRIKECDLIRENQLIFSEVFFR